MDLLFAMRDLGVAVPVTGDAGDEHGRERLMREITREAGTNASSRPLRQVRRRRAITRLAGGRRRVAAIAASGILIACAGAAGAVVDPWSLLSTEPATTLFSDNPAYWNQDNPPNSNTAVIASSVTELGTINVPGVGAFQYWGAQTKNGEWCEAFKAPDGLWAGTPATASDKVDPSYNFGGSVPGCGTYSNVDQGGGFHWGSDEIGPITPGNNGATVNDLSAVIYGTVDDPGSATKVIDATTGASTPLLDGHYFVLVLPRRSLGTIRLEAVDASGKIIAEAEPYAP